MGPRAPRRQVSLARPPRGRSARRRLPAASVLCALATSEAPGPGGDSAPPEAAEAREGAGSGRFPPRGLSGTFAARGPARGPASASPGRWAPQRAVPAEPPGSAWPPAASFAKRSACPPPGQLQRKPLTGPLRNNSLHSCPIYTTAAKATLHRHCNRASIRNGR